MKELSSNRVAVIKSRHENMVYFFFGLFVCIIITSIVWGTVLYNLERIKHPVKVEQKFEQNYDRGQ
jgi:hypothetical protein